MLHDTLNMLQKRVRIGVDKFNVSPQTGINFLVQKGHIEDSPEGICRFLSKASGLSKRRLGEYFGKVSEALCCDFLCRVRKTVVASCVPCYVCEIHRKRERLHANKIALVYFLIFSDCANTKSVLFSHRTPKTPLIVLTIETLLLD